MQDSSINSRILQQSSLANYQPLACRKIVASSGSSCQIWPLKLTSIDFQSSYWSCSCFTGWLHKTTILESLSIHRIFHHLHWCLIQNFPLSTALFQGGLSYFLSVAFTTLASSLPRTPSPGIARSHQPWEVSGGYPPGWRFGMLRSPAP